MTARVLTREQRFEALVAEYIAHHWSPQAARELAEIHLRLHP